MKTRILIVDDEELNRDILSDTLEDDYDILTAANGREALDIIRENGRDIGIVLLDLMMDDIDGFGVLEAMKEEGYIGEIPVIIITGDATVSSAVRCFEYGASDFVTKPFSEPLVKRRVENTVNLYAYKNSLEDKVEEQTEELRLQNITLKELNERLESYNQRMIEILGTVVDHRDMESGAHIQRVKGYSAIIARNLMEMYPEYGITPEIVALISNASVLHDVGKIAIPDSILLKPGRLTQEEFELMKTHTVKGYEILEAVEGAWSDDYAKYCGEICRHHHERWDGRGYPDHLAGDDIPVSAQIVSVVDVYDALIHERVYKGAFSLDQAYAMIENGECGIFGKKILDAFLASREELEALEV